MPSKLYFFLSSPRHSFAKFKDTESWQLIFEDAKLTKGVGKLPISYEIHNYEDGDNAASHWETRDVASDDVQNVVHFRMDGAAPDLLLVECPPRLVVLITLSPESFSRLLTINWKEKFVILKVVFKHPATVPDKLPIDWKTKIRAVAELPIDSYWLDWQERPISPDGYLQSGTSTQINLLGRLLRSIRR